MKRVAVLGGGPAGAFAAENLASAGVDTILLDEKLAWEKPCGGGLTYKAYSQYPFLLNNEVSKRLVTETRISAPKAGHVSLKLAAPLLIYSRFDLNSLLLDRAVRAGAKLEQTRVLAMERFGSGWKLRTKNGFIETDFCVLATGARNPLRNFGTELSAADSMLALGYYVPGHRDQIDIQFLRDLEGYIWVFPRCGHLSVGICGKGEPASKLRKRLEDYMAEQDLSTRESSFYSHLLPSLDTPAWKNNRVAGDGWLAVGDAAGLVDPITGEGLYYAMRSADLASKSLLADLGERTEHTYRRLLRRDFASDLEFGSRLAKRIFRGQFLCAPLPARLVEFTRRSPRFMSIVQDLFAGTQNYLTLKRRLLTNLNGSLWEIGVGVNFSRWFPSATRPQDIV